MMVKFKRLRDNAILPKLPRAGDAGIDLYASLVVRTDIDNIVKCFTGLAVEIPENHVGLLFPRSSVYKKDLFLSNAVGVIDSGFRGEIIAIFKLYGESEMIYETGEKCCQLVILPLPQITEIDIVDKLSETERGSGGFGSTGK